VLSSVRAVLRGPRGWEAWVWAAAAARPGRAAAWRSRALGPAHFQTQSAFGRNRALSGRARRAKLWALSSGRCRRAVALSSQPCCL